MKKIFSTKHILVQSKAPPPFFIAYTFAQKMFILLPFLRQETAFYVPQSFRCVYRYHETKCFEKKNRWTIDDTIFTDNFYEAHSY